MGIMILRIRCLLKLEVVNVHILIMLERQHIIFGAQWRLQETRARLEIENLIVKIMNQKIKIAGITRIRNEEHIIQDTLDYFAEFCNAGIYVYDDCSTDDTLKICALHPAVKIIMRGSKWSSDSANRKRDEGRLRQSIFDEAKLDNPDWFFYFDADERPVFDWSVLAKSFSDPFNGYKLRLFDYYITADDVGKKWHEREWIGPEYRDILMLFRNVKGIKFKHREPTLPKGSFAGIDGFCKHYGKAISVKHWEETCDYYINHRFTIGRLHKRWKARKGKAVHTVSDFGLPLIKWEDRIEKGISLMKRRKQIGMDK